MQLLNVTEPPRVTGVDQVNKINVTLRRSDFAAKSADKQSESTTLDHWLNNEGGNPRSNIEFILKYYCNLPINA